MSGEGVQKCSKGHAMDPSWDSCPYCAAEETAAQKSPGNEAVGKPAIGLSSESVDKPTIDLTPAEPAGHAGRKTIVGDIPQPSNERQTIVHSSDQISNPPISNAQNDTRKIVGALVTYSWVQGGQIFPVREGKNFIGSVGQSCDVLMSQDAKMSGVHALILCRSGKNELIDQQSSNGTFLNGEILSSNQSVDLDNYAEIKTGSTLWTFVKIEQSPPS